MKRVLWDDNKEKLGRKPEKNVFRCDDQSL